MFKFKKSVIAAGISFGVAGGMVAMLPKSHHADAAIAVIDLKKMRQIK